MRIADVARAAGARSERCCFLHRARAIAKGLPARGRSVGPWRRGWPAARFEEALRPFFAEHAAIRIDPEARSPKNTMVTLSEDGAIQRVTQVILDTEEQNDWVLEAEVDLGRSRAEGRPVVTVTGPRG